jgi:peroxiredoxin
MFRLIPIFIAVSCVPVLESPQTDSGVDSSDCAAWQVPENGWTLGSPPDCLAAEGVQAGQVITDMRMMDQHGDEVSLWQFHGDIIVLDFSTMWCAPCAVLAEDVDETWKEYEDEGFMYLSVLSQDHVSQVPDLEELNKWADDHKITAPVLQDDAGYTDSVIPPGGAFPQIMLIGRDLRILDVSIEPAEDPSIRAAVEANL